MDPIIINKWILKLANKSNNISKTSKTTLNQKQYNALSRMIGKLLKANVDPTCIKPVCNPDKIDMIYDLLTNTYWSKDESEITKNEIIDFKLENDITYLEIYASLRLFIDYNLIPMGIEELSKDKPLPAIIKSRENLIKDLKDKKSLTDAECDKLRYQLSGIDDYIDGTRKSTLMSSLDPEEILINEVAEMSNKVSMTSKDNIRPRDNQLISVLQFLEGRSTLLQAGTGQGKSLIVAMTAILQTKLKRPIIPGDDRPMCVHVMTVTQDLIKDGLDSNKALFKACNVHARKISDPKKKIDDILYGTPHDFEFQALQEATFPDKEKQVLILDEARRTVIVDESDSQLVDRPSGRILLTDPDPKEDTIKKVLIHIAKVTENYYLTDYENNSRYTIPIEFHMFIIINKVTKFIQTNYPDFINRWKLDQNQWVTNALQIYNPDTIWIPGKKFVLRNSLKNDLDFLSKNELDKSLYDPINESIEKFKRDYEFYNSKFIDVYDIPNTIVDKLLNKLNPFKKVLIQWYDHNKMIDGFIPKVKSCFNRIIQSIENIKEDLKLGSLKIYGIVITGQVKYIDIETGQVIDNMRYWNGIHEILEYKYLGIIYTKPTLTYRSFSLHRYIRESELVLGLSGTIGTEDKIYKFQKKVWRVNNNPVIIPNFVESRLEPKGEINVDTEDEWHEEIYKEVSKVRLEQPILIITVNPKIANDLNKYLTTRNIPSSIYEASTDNHVTTIQLNSSEIIIATNLGGRGSDYKYNQSTAMKGLHVIIGFSSDEQRIMDQAKGRAGRAGNPGSFKIISFGNKLKQSPNIMINCDLIKQTLGTDIIFEIYLYIKKIIEQYQLFSDSKDAYDFIEWISNSDVKNDIINKLLGIDNHKKNKEYISALEFIFKKWISLEEKQVFPYWIRECIEKKEIPEDIKNIFLYIKTNNSKKNLVDINTFSKYILDLWLQSTSGIPYIFSDEEKTEHIENLTESIRPHFDEIIRLDMCST